MTSVRLAASLDVLRSEVNACWPNRSKVSDGTTGDAAHRTRRSDHNPNPAGVVRALDITAAGIDADTYAEKIRTLGAAGHPPLRDGGLIIWNRRSASASTGWQWRPYRGTNPHTAHIHVSVSRDRAGFDDRTPWGIRTTTPTPTAANTKDDLMPALTDKEQRELLDKVRLTEGHAHTAALLAASVDQRCDRLEGSIHGTNDANRATSIWWLVRYLHGELLGGENGPRLRKLLRKHDGA